MAKYVPTGTESHHKVYFTVDGQLVVPTDASYTLRKNDGSVVGGIEDESLPTSDISDTSVVINIPAEANETTLDYEVRFLEVSFTTSDTNVHNITQYYHLRTNMLFPLSVEDVEAVLGFDAPDGYIDIFAAYDLVQLDAEGVNLQTVLDNGTSLVPALIDAVKYKAALTASVNIQTSMMQMEQADNTLYRRFDSVDFQAVGTDLSARYSIALNKLMGLTPDTLTNNLLAVVAVGTDPVTGA